MDEYRVARRVSMSEESGARVLSSRRLGWLDSGKSNILQPWVTEG